MTTPRATWPASSASKTRGALAIVADLLDLAKPRITLLVIVTTLVGFTMASPAGVWPALLASTLLGTGLVAAGAGAINMVLERDIDARMLRTRRRSLPSGRLTPGEALSFGLLTTTAGLLTLLAACPPAAGAVAALTWGTYLFVYTPLKRRTAHSIFVGAVSGALPPVLGWVAAGGRPSAAGSFVLFAIVFAWQIPHLLAIAWVYQDDYARAALPVVPAHDPDGRVRGRQIAAASVALLLVGLLPALARMAGALYVAGATVCGIALVAIATRVARSRTLSAARSLFFASLFYLPALFALLLLDRRQGP